MTRPLSSRVSVNPKEGELRIPAGVRDFQAFRRWSWSRRFPQRGRIDYLQGDIDASMSPEDLLTHATPKAAIAAGLFSLIVEPARGLVFVDSTRYASPAAQLSVEPDVVVVRHESLAAGRVRMVQGVRPRPGRYIELEGAPDLVVEVISDSSVGKDRRRLPDLYAQAGVPELWLVDARDTRLAFEIWTLGTAAYTQVLPDPAGGTSSTSAWAASPILGCRFRLRRHERHDPPVSWYTLESTGARS